MDETQNQAVGDQALPNPLPLSEVEELRVQLRQKDETIRKRAETIHQQDDTILRKDRMFQRACETAREAELRAERAETLLDTKRDIIDGTPQQSDEELQKRMADLQAQLVEARRSEEEATLRRIQADRTTDAHKVEIVETKRRADGAENVKKALLRQNERLTNDSEQAKRDAKQLKDKNEVLEQEMAALKEKMDDERKKMEDSNRDKEVLLQRIERMKDESEQTRREAKELKDMKSKCEALDRENAVLKEGMDEERRKNEDSTKEKEELVRQNERMNDESEKAKREAEDSKKKCQMLEQKMTTLEEANCQRRKKLAEQMASVKSEADSKLAFLQAQFAELQQQDPHTVQDYTLDQWNGGDFDPAIQELNPIEEPGTGDMVDTVDSDMISNSNPSFLTGPKKEPIDVSQAIINDNQKFEMDDAALKVDDSFNDPLPNNTISENHDSFQSLNDIPMDFENENEQTEIQQGNREEPSIDDLVREERETEEEDDEVETRRRSSRITSKPLKSIESMEDSDDDTVIPVKKPRCDSAKKNGIMSNLSGGINESSGKDNREKESETEMECPRCEYRTRSANAWRVHLRVKHSTTPFQAGVALLCECGVECSSEKHVYKCDVANFTVIQKKKVNPQKCVLCETYPKTAYGYTMHLHRHHNSTLLKNGIYLTCSCGLVVRSHDIDHSHNKKCDDLFSYSLHKLDEMSESGEKDKKTGSTPRGKSTIGNVKDNEEKGAKSGMMKRRRIASETSDSDESFSIVSPPKKTAAAAAVDKTGRAANTTAAKGVQTRIQQRSQKLNEQEEEEKREKDAAEVKKKGEGN